MQIKLIAALPLTLAAALLLSACGNNNNNQAASSASSAMTSAASDQAAASSAAEAKASSEAAAASEAASERQASASSSAPPSSAAASSSSSAPASSSSAAAVSASSSESPVAMTASSSEPAPMAMAAPSSSLSEMVAAMERTRWEVSDVEVLRYHYAHTLEEWYRRVTLHERQIVDLYDERLFRMWQFYLVGAEQSFRGAGMVNFQVQSVKRRDAVPMTRDYIIHEAARLSAAEEAPEWHLASHLRDAAE